MTRKEILDTASKQILGERSQDYGTPENNFNLIADFWKTYLYGKYGVSLEINGVDVANMMSLLKIARMTKNEKYADNYVDLAGYAACAGELGSTIFLTYKDKENVNNE